MFFTKVRVFIGDLKVNPGAAIINLVCRPAWYADEDGYATLRLFGFVNFTFYKWQDGAIITFGQKGFVPVAKRGIVVIATVEKE